MIAPGRSARIEENARMSSPSRGTGSEFLARKSDLTRMRQKIPGLKDVLIVDDNNFDADSLRRPST